MILVIGPTGVGKTLFLKQLEAISKNSQSSSAKRNKITPETRLALEEERENVPATMPTIGTNITNAGFGRKKELSLTEVGGSMAPLWKSYFKDTKKLVYIIDISNPFQVSCATTKLLETIASPDLQDTPVLLMLNKIDCFSTVSHAEMKSLLMLDSIIAHSSQVIKTIETSVKYKSGLEDVIEWMYQDP